MKKTILILIIILIASTAHSFTFDVWESGMDVDTVIMTAMKNDLPLKKEGYTSTGKKFDKRYCVPFRKTATTYNYTTKLLGKTAQVTLYLTKKEKKLMKASIRWYPAGTLLSVLEKIVKNKKPISKRKKGGIFIKTTSYKINDETEIDLTMTSNVLTMDYKDLPAIAYDAKTKQKKQIKRRNKAIIKDSGKF